MTSLSVRFQQLACVGAGIVGSSWALQFAMSGHQVTLQDVKEEILRNAVRTIENSLDTLIESKVVKEARRNEIMSRITTTTELRDVSHATYVQESVLERINIKKEVFRRLEKVVSDEAIIASSTSGLLMSEIQGGMKHPGRTVIAHPFNPAHLIPLVEIVPGKKTSGATVRAVMAFMTSLGKKPVLLKKEVAGFAADRIQFAMYREVLNLLDDGVLEMEDIEKIFTAALGLRLALMGPFTIQALAGGPGGLEQFYEHLSQTAGNILRDVKTWTSIPESAREKAVSGSRQMAALRGKPYDQLLETRDKKLIGLMKHVGLL